MVRHNNMIPNGHFHKKWQAHIRTAFDQPMKKKRRSLIRTRKFLRNIPQPIKLLRPLVHCPSARYNAKTRVGRGFTLQELKQAGLNKKLARTIGIAVDHRRRNRCLESVFRNAQRLEEYKEKLILPPVKTLQIVVADMGMNLNKVKPPPVKTQAKVVTEEERKFEAYVTLRKARSALKVRRKKSSKFDVLEGGKSA